ncbi:hypothetical protein [Latilactobacillus sakei]|uniref:hypothetical protein n=1 Tax=Latilactobacillus sakei TaxID=1599 RepID=UPI003F534F9F
MGKSQNNNIPKVIWGFVILMIVITGILIKRANTIEHEAQKMDARIKKADFKNMAHRFSKLADINMDSSNGNGLARYKKEVTENNLRGELTNPEDQAQFNQKIRAIKLELADFKQCQKTQVNRRARFNKTTQELADKYLPLQVTATTEFRSESTEDDSEAQKILEDNKDFYTTDNYDTSETLVQFIERKAGLTEQNGYLEEAAR